MNTPSVDVVFISDDAGSNSLGRVFSLWKLSEAAGLSSATVTASGDAVWGPVEGGEFARTVVSNGGVETIERLNPKVIVCVKPLPLSFALATRAQRKLGVPMILDIDDPDIEAGLSYGDPIRRIAKVLLRPRSTYWFLRARRAARRLPVMVSNPVLQTTYGGVLLPHVRDEVTTHDESASARITIAFVGTNRPHKGINVLRTAVESAATSGFRLVITDDQPEDHREWEEWIGRTSLEDGLQLAAQSDIIVIPSLDTRFAQGQLPAKLVDAMMAGKAIVASDLPSIRWALSGTGILVRPGDSAALAEALRRLADPAVRQTLGASAGARGRVLFSVDRNATVFAAAVRSALGETRDDDAS